MSQTQDDGGEHSRFAHLSQAHPEWNKVASKQRELEPLAQRLYSLPLEEFRKVPYRPPPLPANAPVPGIDIIIREDEVIVRDGAKVKVRMYEPVHLSSRHLLFFNIHGGGWTTGSPETEEAQNRLIAANCSAVVCSVDYRRAPEFPFPYALNDSVDALKWCKQHAGRLGINPEKIIVGGGSAGANVCAAVAQISSHEGITGIIGQILNIPVTCHPDHFPKSKYEYSSYVQNANSPIVSASMMRIFWKNYLPRAHPDPRTSPLLAPSFKGLPPALVQVAGMDPLRDEGLAYAEAMKAEGVNITLKIYPGMPHAFYVYPDLEPSVEYFEAMVDWINQF
ncbi:lipase esterase family protein [Ilyonectria robusta]|uniref:lipase esterase family protein n=1 Tax=Ilyonectria robusta TaxID=1079257 RepID=UPI001E8CB44A|nr:lipase esterase family protein [Ilyonectria robusta]KAH8714616.1 lipase esterase family protein [Ilyonectria robusta]